MTCRESRKGLRECASWWEVLFASQQEGEQVAEVVDGHGVLQAEEHHREGRCGVTCDLGGGDALAASAEGVDQRGAIEANVNEHARVGGAGLGFDDVMLVLRGDFA